MIEVLAFAVAAILLLVLCGHAAYRMGYREGREQGFAESYRLYVNDKRAPCSPQKETEKSAS